MRAAVLVILAFLTLPILIPISRKAIAAQATTVATVDRDGRLKLPAPKAGRRRPLVAVVGENRGAEVTDFTIPYGVLKSSGAADVRSVSTRPGPVQLKMAIRVRADQTTAQFDTAYPDGADIVIVPAQAHPHDKALVAWIKAQADRGAVVVSICEGARVVARAGLLRERRATTHWGALEALTREYPDTTWVRDRRYVQDGPVISTTGVSASLPASLALVEAIGGRDVAAATAARFGVVRWGPAHDTGAFSLTSGEIARAIAQFAAVWNHESVEAPVVDGVDEVALAFRADVWSRTFRSKVVTTRPGRIPTITRNGLTILPDAEPRPGRYVIPDSLEPASVQLDESLAAVRRRYGPFAERLALLGLEYAPS